MLASLLPQNLTNIVWALASLGVPDRPLMYAISSEFLRKITECNGQNLANTVWAFATLGVLHHPLLNAISAQAIKSIISFHS